MARSYSSWSARAPAWSTDVPAAASYPDPCSLVRAETIATLVPNAKPPQTKDDHPAAGRVRRRWTCGLGRVPTPEHGGYQFTCGTAGSSMRVYLLPCPAPCDSAQRAALRPADLAVDAFTQADATTWYAVIPGRTDALGTRWARIAFEHVWNAPPGVLPGGAQVVYVGIGADVAETELPAVEKTIVTLRSSM